MAEHTAASDADVTSPTAALAAFAAGLSFHDIPAAVVEHAKRCVLDTFGCGLYGSTLPWTALLRGALRAVDPGGPAPLWGTGDRLSAPNAALVNGTAVHAFELDDLHKRAIVHPGSVVTSAALAAAALTGTVTGRDLVAAMVAGYEVASRVGMSVGTAHLLAGWHPTGTHGTLGAAAAAGSILGLDARQMRDALGIAGSESAGLMAAQYASMVKRLHAGRAAQSGVYAAVLARQGFTGIAELFEAGYGGYCTTFSPSHDLVPLTAGLGERWETAAIGFKPYSANGSCHPSIDALLELREGEGIGIDDVARVDIAASSATVQHVGWDYQPGSVTTAQMNLPYIVAVVLADGDAFVDQFTAERITDPALVAFSRKVHVAADPAIDARGDTGRHATRVQLTMIDGRHLTVFKEHARGSAAQPLTADEVTAKYRKLAAKALDDAGVDALAAAVGRLDSIDNVGEVLALLARPGR